ncbi:MAG: 6-carboxytetrahydropterin synthase [Flavobacteriaceae bacterium]|jgi:6-pyruvoyltetrahydropterin/6-carboxytetrahydropterin synthase|nr:6-carboxytetrahydropterin synthase [Flavobacteriaceae bacterium]MBL6692548.1 6-carboxytetrahydropterin synthase [Flavobacteriaceae bacterium]CAI8180232.1 MAG: 6-carboxy-5,6,7,8-tetrahydropterin synthase [Flavobacteriaceae bacterium]|tara:strand:+ start:882 stop:1298 length:417 start_codon:yes stop_codon:yes gene_type:complete
MRVTVCRKAHFNAAHRLFVKSWDDKKNETVFGKCANPYYHGHNYELIVNVTGTIDPVTGYVMDMKVLKDLIKAEVEDAFDHKNLNEQVPEFADLIPSAENIAVVIYDKLLPHLDSDKSLEVVLYETPRNFVKYSGPLT